MPRHVTVPDDTFARLSAAAAARNLTVDEFVRPLLETVVPPTESLPLTGEAWRAELAGWKQDAANRSDRYPPRFQLDDSRDTIYREREDAQL
ncbi:hypothetical protein [Fimbriiglobus ruber]|uniref:hypothetical protein n=1 Tax=Fimbriiglobus ruber TaxID=1908690 RepID=UPI000B4A5B03|nr:hypothetical protein [Fimbriiglobus ruber]